MAEHHHAVVRDLNDLGYRGGALIFLDDFTSIVLASPPGSAVRYFVEGGWSQTDHLLANLAEQQAGIGHLPQRFTRPGAVVADDVGPEAPGVSGRYILHSRDDFMKRRARDMARADQLAATERDIS